ncbi:MAG: nucleotidyltransferase family protein [Hydrogenothermaceae bacterium]
MAGKLNSKEIISIIKKHKGKLIKEYGVKEIALFGSYIRGEEREDSDIDILVEFDEKSDVDLIKFINMELYLSNLLGKKVDLVEKSSLKPRISKYILQEAVKI